MAKKLDPYSYEGMVENAKKYLKPDKNGNRILPKETDEKFRQMANNLSNLTEKLKIEEDKQSKEWDEYNKEQKAFKEWEQKVAALEKEIKDLKAGEKSSMPDSSFGPGKTFATKDDYQKAVKTVRSQLYPSIFQRVKKWLSK